MENCEENKENNNVNSVEEQLTDAKLTTDRLNGVNDEVTYTQYESELQMKVSRSNIREYTFRFFLF